MAVNPPYGYPHGFQPGETYTAILKVENYCGDEAEEEITFTFEAVECVVGNPAGRIAITDKYPNPFSGTLQVDFTTQEAGHLEIWLVPAAGGTDVLAHSEYLFSPGSYQRSLSTGQVQAGTHYLALCLGLQTIYGLRFFPASTPYDYSPCYWVTLAREEQAPEPVSLFPNPTGGTIWFSLPDGAEAAHWQLFGINGALLQEQRDAVANEAVASEVELTGLPAGIYQLLLRGSDGKRYWGRGVKH